MARLHEYQGKAILAANGFTIPRGRAALAPDDAVLAAKELAGGKKGTEVVTKIQAWTTGRAATALPINVDGATGAILADLGMNRSAFNGIFMMARRPGLVTHVLEEQSREKPMRRIDPVKHGYDGPAPRSVV
jgi:citrate synthase